MKLIFLISVILSGIGFTQEKPIVLKTGELRGEHNFRLAIKKSYPNIEPCFYHFNGQVVFGMFRESKKGRLLLLLDQNFKGKVTIQKNGKELKSDITTPAILHLQYVHDPKPNKEDIVQIEFGRWIPAKTTDTFSLTLQINQPLECKMVANYHPDTGWTSSMTPPTLDPNLIKKADAYHFTENSLLSDVRHVLKKQPSCRVKLPFNRIITVTKPIREKNADLDPMLINITQKISINHKQAEEELADISTLRERLASYSAAARAGAALPKILLRISPNASDTWFRKVLDALDQENINTAQMETSPKAPHPRQKRHIHLPQKP